MAARAPARACPQQTEETSSSGRDTSTISSFNQSHRGSAQSSPDGAAQADPFGVVWQVSFSSPSGEPDVLTRWGKHLFALVAPAPVALAAASATASSGLERSPRRRSRGRAARHRPGRGPGGAGSPALTDPGDHDAALAVVAFAPYARILLTVMGVGVAWGSPHDPMDSCRAPPPGHRSRRDTGARHRDQQAAKGRTSPGVWTHAGGGSHVGGYHIVVLSSVVRLVGAVLV